MTLIFPLSDGSRISSLSGCKSSQIFESSLQSRQWSILCSNSPFARWTGRAGEVYILVWHVLLVDQRSQIVDRHLFLVWLRSQISVGPVSLAIHGDFLFVVGHVVDDTFWNGLDGVMSVMVEGLSEKVLLLSSRWQRWSITAVLQLRLTHFDAQYGWLTSILLAFSTNILLWVPWTSLVEFNRSQVRRALLASTLACF